MARQTLVAWLLPAADELARGADVVAVDDRTVTVVADAPGESKQEPAMSTGRIELRLIFTKDGPLAERQLVRSDSYKLLL
jgi:hypothetical protein